MQAFLRFSCGHGIRTSPSTADLLDKLHRKPLRCNTKFAAEVNHALSISTFFVGFFTGGMSPVTPLQQLISGSKWLLLASK